MAVKGDKSQSTPNLSCCENIHKLAAEADRCLFKSCGSTNKKKLLHWHTVLVGTSTYIETHISQSVTMVTGKRQKSVFLMVQCFLSDSDGVQNQTASSSHTQTSHILSHSFSNQTIITSIIFTSK